MARPLFALAALFLVALCSEEYDRFCHDLPCPRYRFIREHPQGFEERSYNQTKWISTPVESAEPEHVTAAYLRLKNFCDKNGEAGSHISHTWPVLISVTDAPEYRMQWFIPPDVSVTEDPPSLITVVTRQATTVYVRVFDGTPSVENGQSNAAQLRQSLTQANISYDHSQYAGAGYDSFFSVTHHNEIWMFEA